MKQKEKGRLLRLSLASGQWPKRNRASRRVGAGGRRFEGRPASPRVAAVIQSHDLVAELCVPESGHSLRG